MTDHICAKLVTKIVAAYVAKNAVPVAEVPGLIQTVNQVVGGLLSTPAPAARPAQTPAVPIKKSVTPDGIICLEDGRTFRSLKRHLASKYGMTPDDYRAKWGLPKDYPMVAPNYSAARSELAKAMGLGQGGRKPKKPVPEVLPAPAGGKTDAPAKRGPGRPRKS
jgi:predicted transcriptional regulator